MTRLSVVVPVLDDVKHLQRLLRALAGQSRPPEEIIVVDNGSTDGSAALAAEAGARVLHEPCRGIAPAAARGYDAAHGQIIVRCDADSLPPADWLERIAGHFDNTPDLQALTGPGYFYDLPPVLGALGSAGYAAAYFLGIGGAAATVPLWGSNMAFRRELWGKARTAVHLHRPGIHDDLDLSCNLPAGTKVRFDPRLRVGAAGRIFTRSAGVWDAVRRALDTLAANGAAKGVLARWRSALGFIPVKR